MNIYFEYRTIGAHTPTHFSFLRRAGMSTLSRRSIKLTPVNMIDTQLLTEIASIPTVSSGNLLSDGSFELNLNIRKYSGDLTKKSNYLWKSSGSGPLSEINSEIKFRSFSPDGNYLLIGRSFCGSEKEKYFFLEVWGDMGNRFLSSINVSKIHGDFCTDGNIHIL